MTDRFLFGIIIDDTIIKNSKAKWMEKDRKKIKGLVSGGHLQNLFFLCACSIASRYDFTK